MYMLGLGVEEGMAVLLKDATFKKWNSQKEQGVGGERDQQCPLLVRLTPDKYPSFYDWQIQRFNFKHPKCLQLREGGINK